MLTHEPIDVKDAQENLYHLAESLRTSEHGVALESQARALDQIAAELPTWQLTKMMLITQPERAQWLFVRLVALFSGAASLLEVQPAVEEVNDEASYSLWLSQVGQALNRAHLAELRLTHLQRLAKRVQNEHQLDRGAACGRLVQLLADGDFATLAQEEV